MSQGSLDLKITFLCQKVCSVARVQTDRHTDTQTDTKVNTEDTLSGFQEFFLQSIIKDRSNLQIRNQEGPIKQQMSILQDCPTCSIAKLQGE